MTSTAASPGRLKVWHESLWSAREDVAQAISQDGMTLLTRTPLPRGTKVFLEFPQEADGLRVGVDATVTHSGQDRMGVRFNGLDAAGRAVVAAWVERLPAPAQNMLLPDALDLPLTPPPVTPAPLPDEASLVETVVTPEPPPAPPKVGAPAPMGMPLTPPPVARRPAYVQSDTLPDLMLEDVPATPALGMDATQELPDIAQDMPVQDMPPLVGAAAVPHDQDLFDNLLSDPQAAAPGAPLEPAVPVAPQDSGAAAMPWETGASEALPELLDTSALEGLGAGLDEPAATPAPVDLELAPVTPAGGASTAAPPPRLLSMPPPSDPEAPGVGDLFEGLGDPLGGPAAGEVDLFAQAQATTPAPLPEDQLPQVSQGGLSELLEEPVQLMQDSLPPMPPVESPQVPSTPPPVGAPASFEPSLQDVTLDSVPAMTAAASMLPQVAVPPPAAEFGRPVSVAGVYRPVQDGVTLSALEASDPGASPAVALDEIAPGSDVLPDLELDATSGDAFFETNWTQEPEGAPAAAPPNANGSKPDSAALDHNAPVTRDPLFDAWGPPVMMPQLAEDTSLPPPSFNDDPDAPVPGAPLLDAPALGDLPPVESLAFQGFGDQTAQVEIPAGVQAFAWAVQNAPPSQQGIPGTPRVPQDSPDFDPVFDLAPVDQPTPPPAARPALPAVLASPAAPPPAPAAHAPPPATEPPPPHAPPAFLDLGAPMRHPTPAPMRLRSSTPAAPPVRPTSTTRAPAAAPAPAVTTTVVPAKFGTPRSSSGAPLLSMDAAHPPAPVVPGSSPRLPPIPAASSPQLPTLPPQVAAPPPAVAQQQYDASFDAALEQGFPAVATPPLGPAQVRISSSGLPTMGTVIPSSGGGPASRPLPPPGAFGPPPALSVDASIMPPTASGTGSRPLPAVLTLGGTPAGGLPAVPPTLPAAPAPQAPAPAPHDPFAFERAVDTDHASRSALVGGGSGGFLGEDASTPGVDLTGAGTTGLLGAPRRHTPSTEPPLSRPDPMVAQAAAFGDLDLSGSPSDALPLASGADMLMQHPDNRFSNAGGERSRTEDALPAVGGILLDGPAPGASFGPPPGGPPAFGRPVTGAPMAFGPPPGSPFGAPASSPGFGAPPSAPGFGAPSAPHFGAPPAGPVFGAPSSPPATFGRPVPGEPLMAPFGRPRTNVDPNSALAPAPNADEDLPLVVQGQLLPPAGAAQVPTGLPPAAQWRSAMPPHGQQPAPPPGQVPATQPAGTGPAVPNLSAEIDRLFDED